MFSDISVIFGGLCLLFRALLGALVLLFPAVVLPAAVCLPAGLLPCTPLRGGFFTGIKVRIQQLC